MNLPPWARGRVALGITAAAAEGRFELQACEDCGTVQYPPREACHRCLSPRLQWRSAERRGASCSASTTLHHSNDLFFRERLPWRLGLVHLDAGPDADGAPARRGRRRAGSRVRVSARASTAPGRRC